MIMTIDVGNTNITVGVFRGDEVVSNFRITTKMPRTSDEYGMLLSNLLEQNSISHDDIEGAPVFASNEYFADGIFHHTVLRKKL